jgi:hypothetical protein
MAVVVHVHVPATKKVSIPHVQGGTAYESLCERELPEGLN